MEFYVIRDKDDDTLKHYAINGQKKGVRRFQNEDGSLTPEGKIRYSKKTGINVRNVANSNPSQYTPSNSNNIDVTDKSDSERQVNKGKTIYLSSSNIRRKTDSTESDGIPEKKNRVIIVARKKEDSGDNSRKVTSNFKIISRRNKEVNDEDDDDTKTVDESNESTEENVENSDEVNEEKETDNEEDTSNRRKITMKVKSHPSSEDLKKNPSSKRRIIVIKK